MLKQAREKRIVLVTILLVPLVVLAAALTSDYVPDDCSGSGAIVACSLPRRLFATLGDFLVFIGNHDKIIVALGTTAIAAFTGTLWWSTYSLLKAGATQIQIAKDTAEAAKLSADVAMGMEVPRLEFRGVQGVAREALREVMKKGQVIATFVNYGRTRAIILRESVVTRVAPALDPQPRYPFGTIRREGSGSPLKEIVNGVANGIRRLPVDLRLSDDEIARVVNRQEFLWVYGYVAYRDFLDTIWTKGFCAVLRLEADGSGAFVHEGPENYTYTRISR